MTERKNEIFSASSSNESSQKQGILSFEVPVVDVPLPSNGKVYSELSSLADKESVAITMMTAAQENILTNKSLAKRGTLMTKLIESCLKDKSIDARDMLIADRAAIMVSLRITGYGSDYKVKIECPECEEKVTQTFDLSKIPVKRLQLEPSEKHANVFEFMLPTSKARVKFRFLTGADEEEITVTQARKKKLAQDSSDADVVTTSLLHSIISINGVTDRSQIAMAIPRMPAFDSRSLRNYIENNEPGMKLKGNMTCPSCDFSGEVDLPLGASFFWPGSE